MPTAIKPKTKRSQIKPDKPRPRIMLVDDDPFIQRMLQMAFKKKYEILTVSSGEDAIESAAYYDPDLIILDVNLPGMDGFSVSKTLRNTAATRHIPILFFTVKNDDGSFLKSLWMGGDSFISKPVSMPELQERIEYLLADRDLS